MLLLLVGNPGARQFEIFELLPIFLART